MVFLFDFFSIYKTNLVHFIFKNLKQNAELVAVRPTTLVPATGPNITLARSIPDGGSNIGYGGRGAASSAFTFSESRDGKHYINRKILFVFSFELIFFC